MRKLFLTLSFVVFSLWLFGQNENPYSQFGYEAPIMPKKESIDTNNVFLITNTDSTASIGFITIDTKNKEILGYSQKGEQIFRDTLLYFTTSRWISPDPANQFHSPYLGMGNNPINGTDPDGAFFLVDDFVIGFVKGMFNSNETAWQSGVRHFTNSAKIWGGLFAADGNRSGIGQAGQIASRFTWEAPQTAIGFVGAHLTNMIGNVREVSYLGGATFLGLNSLPAGYGGITFGSFITVESPSSPFENVWAMHEYGHYLQSMRSGPLYLFKYGIPSALNQGCWVEDDADYRTANYFQVHHNAKYPFKTSESDVVNPKLWEYNPLFPIIAPITNFNQGR